MAKHDDLVLTDSETLRELADRIGKDRLLDEIEASKAVSRWTATEMLKGTYKKSLREGTQLLLLGGLKKYGLTERTLFKRVSARGKKTA